MGRKSRIDIIPEDARGALQAWLADPAISQAEATEALHAYLDEQDWDGPRPSESSVNRYAQRFSAVMQRRREANEVAQHWVAQFGRVPQGQLGQLIIQMIQGMAFDQMVSLDGKPVDPEDLPGHVKMLRDLAQMAERTERAASLNADRERTIREEQRAEDAAKLDELAKRDAQRGAGRTLDPDTLRRIREEIYGIVDAPEAAA
jgi:hypothetical protein